jgi:hypothetical protein
MGIQIFLPIPDTEVDCLPFVNGAVLPASLLDWCVHMRRLCLKHLSWSVPVVAFLERTCSGRCFVSSSFNSAGDVDRVLGIRRRIASATAEAILLQVFSFRTWQDVWLLVRAAKTMLAPPSCCPS